MRLPENEQKEIQEAINGYKEILAKLEAASPSEHWLAIATIPDTPFSESLQQCKCKKEKKDRCSQQ